MVDKKLVVQLIEDLLSSKNEDEQLIIYNKISDIVLDPEWSDYIFHSYEYYDENDNLNVELVADKIISYKPIIL